MAIVATYNHRFSTKVKQEIEEIESRVNEKWGMDFSGKVNKKIIHWVTYTSFKKKSNQVS